MEGNEVLGNEADSVGGMVAMGTGRMIFSNNTVEGNWGRSSVGGVGLEVGTFIVAPNRIANNRGLQGGGIEVYASLAVTPTYSLDANEIVGNHATKNGGGVLVWPDTVFTTTNNIIATTSGA